MARITAAQFAQQLHERGAGVYVRNDHEVSASYYHFQVIAYFSHNTDAFEVAWRTDYFAPADAPIRTVAGVRRALRLPKQPTVTLGTTNRPNSRIHISSLAWRAECGVHLSAPLALGSPEETTCPRCWARWRKYCRTPYLQRTP